MTIFFYMLNFYKNKTRTDDFSRRGVTSHLTATCPATRFGKVVNTAPSVPTTSAVDREHLMASRRGVPSYLTTKVVGTGNALVRGFIFMIIALQTNNLYAQCFTTSNTNPCGGEIIDFQINTPNDSTVYTWNFGDGSNEMNGETVSHQFPGNADLHRQRNHTRRDLYRNA